MKIILHIGTEKTGTTSIQSVLSKNRDALLKNKILYAKTLGIPNNVKLAAMSQNYNKIDDLRIRLNLLDKKSILSFENQVKKDLSIEINENKPDILIISSEHLSSRLITEEEIGRLYSFLNNFSNNIEVIVYLRRQDKYYESLLSTAIKTGNYMNFSFPEKSRFDFHYYKLLSLWEKFFKKIRIKIFEKDKLVKGDVVQDFIRECNLPISIESVEKENKSFGKKKLFFLNEFNKFVPEITDNKINPSRGNIVKILEEINIDDEPLRFDYEERKNFLKRFESGNQKVAKKYLKEENLFEKIEENDKKIKLDVSVDDISDIFSKIWIKKQRELNEVKLKNKFLKVDIALLEKKYDIAEELVGKMEIDNPAHPRVKYYRAILLYEKKDLEKAEVELVKAIELNNKNQNFLDLLKKITRS